MRPCGDGVHRHGCPVQPAAEGQDARTVEPPTTRRVLAAREIKRCTLPILLHFTACQSPSEMMDSYQKLVDEIDRIVNSPYPTQLKVSHPSNIQLARIRTEKPHQVFSQLPFEFKPRWRFQACRCRRLSMPFEQRLPVSRVLSPWAEDEWLILKRIVVFAGLNFTLIALFVLAIASTDTAGAFQLFRRGHFLS